MACSDLDRACLGLRFPEGIVEGGLGLGIHGRLGLLDDAHGVLNLAQGCERFWPANNVAELSSLDFLIMHIATPSLGQLCKCLWPSQVVKAEIRGQQSHTGFNVPRC